MSDITSLYFSKLSQCNKTLIYDHSAQSVTQLTGQQIVSVVNKIYSVLLDAGVRKGEKIIIRTNNNIFSALLILSALRYDLCILPLPSDTNDNEIRTHKQNIGAAIALSCTPDGVEVDNKMYSLCDILEKPEYHIDSFFGEFPCLITLTSGTTGRPKYVVHSANNLVNCSLMFNSAAGISEDDKFLNILPMYYMAGIFNCLISPLAACSVVHIRPMFSTLSALEFWSVVKSYDITALWLAPTMLSIISKLDRTLGRPTHNLRRLFVGTASLSSTDAKNFYDKYGVKPIQSYGLSELLFVALDNIDSSNFGSVGTPLKGITISFNTESRISISSPFQFMGYLSSGRIKPASSIFITSDLGYFDQSGKLWISGRSDHIIVRGGVNINPVYLEQNLEDILCNYNFCIIGMPDLHLGQRVSLITESYELAQEEKYEVLKLVRSLSGQQTIDFFQKVQKFPRTVTGKLQRKKLVEILLSS